MVTVMTPGNNEEGEQMDRIGIIRKEFCEGTLSAEVRRHLSILAHNNWRSVSDWVFIVCVENCPQSEPLVI